MEVVEANGLRIAKVLHAFVAQEALAGSGVSAAQFWSGYAALIADLAPRNRALLDKRDALQANIDAWLAGQRGQPADPAASKSFLRDIGYLVPEPPPFTITTANVDAEIAHIAGPQLVVPISNARYALNAANARFGSLYDALYGTDAIAEDGGAARGGRYNKVRGGRVVARVREYLDRFVPLAGMSHAEVALYVVREDQLVATSAKTRAALRDPAQFIGWQGEPHAPTAILLRHHGLHIILKIDRMHPVGATDQAGMADVILESAVSTIMDCEDSVAAVDAEDKVGVYRNWLGLTPGHVVGDIPEGWQASGTNSWSRTRFSRRQGASR